MSITTSLELLKPPAPPKPFEPMRQRLDFPILHQLVNGKPLVYFDNAASTQKPQCVIDAIREYYENDHSNVHRAVHTLSERATKAYELARLKAQKFLNANCLREVIFTKGTTEAINLVAHSFGQSQVLPGDEVVISAMEHHANIVPWQLVCQEKNATLRVIPINDQGELLLDEYEKLLNVRTKLVAITHVSNALGTVNPIKTMVRLAHQKGIPVFVDGAQATPHMKVDVRDLDCDFYSLSSHKIYGPTGMGVLYGKARHLELMPPYQTGGDMISYVSFEKTTWNELPYKFEAGTPNMADAVGMGVAMDYLESQGRDKIGEHEKQLLDRATEGLRSISGVRILGTAKEKAGVLSFVVDEPAMAAVDVGTKLDLAGIAVRTGHHCCQPLMARFNVPGSIRASFGLYNTLDEVDQFVNTLEKIVGEGRSRAMAQGVELTTLNGHVTYPTASGENPEAAADEVAEVFEFLEEWTDRYQHIIEMGSKSLPMPEYLKSESNRVLGCQSTVFLDLRAKPGSPERIEFLADSDAEVVRGLTALLQTLFSGQLARQVRDFDVEGFFRRIGLDKNLSMGRRNGLSEMTKRIQTFAAKIANV